MPFDSLAAFLVWVLYQAMVVVTLVIVTWHYWVPIVAGLLVLQWIVSRRNRD
jgi:hypothetical protein